MDRKYRIALSVLGSTLLCTPVRAMEAYGWVALADNDFHKSKFADQVKAHGTDDFDSMTTAQGDVVLDCGKALFLYGGRKALKEAFDGTRKAFIIQSRCDKPRKLAVFVSTVGVRMGLATKQIIMITPANSDSVGTIGEEYMYKYQPDKDAKSNLYETIAKSQLKKMMLSLEK
ncbi:hypothetical protein [Azohydromonas aeria]|uniref:hypothetical protein n=1 Tax=Azohydromonas aeria TaxID=2590212 RepID=UPI0012FC7849|nr:hypothetical protein [Azohydromonas aeria]